MTEIHVVRKHGGDEAVCTKAIVRLREAASIGT